MIDKTAITDGCDGTVPEEQDGIDQKWGIRKFMTRTEEANMERYDLEYHVPTEVAAGLTERASNLLIGTMVHENPRKPLRGP